MQASKQPRRPKRNAQLSDVVTIGFACGWGKFQYNPALDLVPICGLELTRACCEGTTRACVRIRLS